MLTQFGIVSSTKKRIIPPSEYQAWWWNYEANLSTLQKYLTGKADARQAQWEKQQKGRG